jgi:hypothetical protein
MTRDGIPSRLSGPVTVHTGPPPLSVPGLTVTRAAASDTATWPPLEAGLEISLERSTDGGQTFRQVSPWLPPGASTFTVAATPGSVYRLTVRGVHGEPPVPGPAVTPGGGP